MKYRIVKKTVPTLTINYKFEYDFIPEIKYSTTYIIQEKESFIHKWINYPKYFNKLEQARVYVEFLKAKTRTKIIKKY